MKETWSLYFHNDYDVIKPLSENSANRKRFECSAPADYYLMKHDVVSWFACENCAGLE